MPRQIRSMLLQLETVLYEVVLAIATAGGGGASDHDPLASPLALSGSGAWNSDDSAGEMAG